MSQSVSSHQQARCLGCWVNGLILDKSLKYLKIIIYVEVATLMAMVREQIVDILGQFYLNHHHGPAPQITQLTAQRTKQISIREKCLDVDQGRGILKLYLH